VIDDCGLSSVNLAEVILRFARDGHNPELVYRQIAGPGITIVPFHGEDATLAAGLVPLTRAYGLSLGDRACLALAQKHGITAITADHASSKVDLPIPVRIIRPAMQQ
jgi:PIN domain nuclease of toxin-antitoxin system